jgi:hypothetical protein
LVGRVKWENSVADQPRAVYADVRPVSHSLLRFDQPLDWGSGDWSVLLENPNLKSNRELTARGKRKTHTAAYALSGDPAKATTAYQDFLALWRDADPDIPILKEAKASTRSCNR